ncbi:hypothetical protein H0O00_01345 [Candidatus Micrarchaeota archaeon]|nr:hypothetical protein [Candidatus Micrarchaeota archaeon]
MVIRKREFAVRRNQQALGAFAKRLAEKERGRVFKDPETALRRFSGLTTAKLSALGSKVEGPANKAYIDAAARKHYGELDDETYYAETVSPRLLAAFHDSLCTLFRLAQDNGNIYAMRRVGVVAEKLTVYADTLLKETRYSTEPTVRGQLTEQSIGMARQVYDEAVLALDGIHKELGVAIAEFPAPSVQ